MKKSKCAEWLILLGLFMVVAALASKVLAIFLGMTDPTVQMLQAYEATVRNWRVLLTVIGVIVMLLGVVVSGVQLALAKSEGDRQLP